MACNTHLQPGLQLMWMGSVSLKVSGTISAYFNSGSVLPNFPVDKIGTPRFYLPHWEHFCSTGAIFPIRYGIPHYPNSEVSLNLTKAYSDCSPSRATTRFHTPDGKGWSDQQRVGSRVLFCPWRWRVFQVQSGLWVALEVLLHKVLPERR